MPEYVINIHKLSEQQEAILTRLSDGQWQNKVKIQSNVSTAFKDNELEEILEKFTEAGILKAGANSSYRMLMPHLTQYRAAKNMTASWKSSLEAPRIFGGILEDDAWELYPREVFDFVNFRTEENTSKVFKTLKTVDPLAQMEADNGLVRIYTKNGNKMYMEIEKLKEDQIYHVKGLRIEKDVMRRDIRNIDAFFFQEFCEFYGKLAPTLLRSKSLSLTSHIKDPDDMKQQAYLWIIDAVRRYDNETSIPFAAYLHNCLNKWVHDLARKEFGRSVADIQLHTSKVRANFTKEHLREPTIDELAEAMNTDASSMKDKISTISKVSAIKNAATVHSEENPVHVVEESMADDNIEALSTKNILTMALLQTAAKTGKQSDINSLNKVYKAVWVNKTMKGDFSKVVDKNFIDTFKREVKTLSED